MVLPKRDWRMINLLDEYDLNEPNYRLLQLAAQRPIEWPDPEVERTSGRPSNALRDLVDLKFLEGPARGQKIRAKPFVITAHGRLILARIEKRLHQPAWITPIRAVAMQAMAGGGIDLVSYNRQREKGQRIRLVTLQSLARAGYVVVQDNRWTLTAVGKEAWEEWLLSQSIAEQIGDETELIAQ